MQSKLQSTVCHNKNQYCSVRVYVCILLTAKRDEREPKKKMQNKLVNSLYHHQSKQNNIYLCVCVLVWASTLFLVDDLLSAIGIIFNWFIHESVCACFVFMFSFTETAKKKIKRKTKETPRLRVIYASVYVLTDIRWIKSKSATFLPFFLFLLLHSFLLPIFLICSFFFNFFFVE